MIPTEAVEAAAKAHQDLQAKRGHPSWDELGALGTHAQKLRLEYMRAALEAAAPYMMAQAWEEGRRADDFEVSIGLDRNPYMRGTEGEK